MPKIMKNQIGNMLKGHNHKNFVAKKTAIVLTLILNSTLL